MQELDEVLERNIEKVIDLTIVHHVEGRRLVTSGKLLSYDKNTITLEMTWRPHFYSKQRKANYICNRQASSILSIVEFETHAHE